MDRFLDQGKEEAFSQVAFDDIGDCFISTISINSLSQNKQGIKVPRFETTVFKKAQDSVGGLEKGEILESEKFRTEKEAIVFHKCLVEKMKGSTDRKQRDYINSKEVRLLIKMNDIQYQRIVADTIGLTEEYFCSCLTKGRFSKKTSKLLILNYTKEFKSILPDGVFRRVSEGLNTASSDFGSYLSNTEIRRMLKNENYEKVESKTLNRIIELARKRA